MAHRPDCTSYYYFKITGGMLVWIVGLLLTGSVIVVLMRRSRLSTPNLLILHLTVADFLGLFTLGPFFLASLFKISLILNSTFCQMSAFISRFSSTLSILIITLTGIARCHSIVRPLDHRHNFYNSRINRISAGLWCFSVLISITPFLGWGKYELIEGQCWCQLNSNKYPYNWFVYFALVFVLPLIVNAGGYALTLRRVILRNKQHKARRKNRRKNSVKRKIFVMQTDREINRDSTSNNTASMTAPDIINSCTENGTSTENEHSHYDKEVDVVVKSEQEIAGSARPTNEDNSLQAEGPEIVNPCKENGQDTDNEYSQYNIKVNVELTEELSRENLHLTVKVKEEEDKMAEEEQSGEIGIVNVCFSESRLNSLGDSISHKENLPKNAKLTNIEQRSLDHKISQKPRRSKDKTENRITLIITSLFLVYLLCSGQFFIVWTWFAIQPKSIPRTVFIAFRFLIGLNSLLNALLYGLVSKEIRSDVLSLWKKMFQRCQCKSDQNDSTD